MTDYPSAIALLHELAADGDPDTFEPDTYDDVFTLGGCALYATALAATRGWQVIAHGEALCLEDRSDGFAPCSDYTGGLCGCMTHHFYALDGNGWAHDIRGQHDLTAIAEFASVQPITDTQLACVLESWHYGCGDDNDIAALAVALTGG